MFISPTITIVHMVTTLKNTANYARLAREATLWKLLGKHIADGSPKDTHVAHRLTQLGEHSMPHLEIHTTGKQIERIDIHISDAHKNYGTYRPCRKYR